MPSHLSVAGKPRGHRSGDQSATMVLNERRYFHVIIGKPLRVLE
jgi:hypothetical protein